MIPDGVVVKITVHGKALPQEFVDCLTEISVNDVSEGQDTATLKFWNADQWLSRRKAFSLGMPVTVEVGITGRKTERIFSGQIDKLEKASNPESLTLHCTVAKTHDPGYRTPDLTSHSGVTGYDAVKSILEKIGIQVDWKVYYDFSQGPTSALSNYYPTMDKTVLQRAASICREVITGKLALKVPGTATVTDHPGRIANPVAVRAVTWGVDPEFVGLETESIAHDEPSPQTEVSMSRIAEYLKVEKVATPANLPTASTTRESYWERLKREAGYVSGGPLKIKLGTNYRAESQADTEAALRALTARIGERSVEGTLRLVMADPVRAIQWIRIKGRYEEDGLYYVDSVGHSITGDYKQSVKLTSKRA